MKAVKKIEIWMDHSIAYIMEFTSNTFEIKTIESKIIIHDNEVNLIAHDKKTDRNKKSNLFTYYNAISEAIKNYKKIVLFGPKQVNMEFFDVLSEDTRFLKTKVEIKETENLNSKEQYDFIRNHCAIE
jgi:stalled ribosome rescue protein Dom34